MPEEKPQHSNRLLIAIIVGIVAGVLVGGLWPQVGDEVSFIGDMFLNALKMLVVPLVMASLIVGVTRLGDVRKLGGIAGRTLVYYLTTTGLSVTVGLILVLLIQPGRVDSEAERISFRGGEMLPEAAYRVDGNQISLAEGAFARDYRPREGKRYMVELLGQTTQVTRGKRERTVPLRGLILELSEDQRTATVREWKDGAGRRVTPQAEGTGMQVDLAVADRVEGKSGSAKDALIDAVKGLIHPNLFDAMVETKILPLLVFALFFGAVLTTVGRPGQVVIEVFRGLDVTIMKMVDLLMYVAPLGIGCLVAGKLASAGGFIRFLPQLQQIGIYALTVVLGLLIHGVITLPLICRLVGKRNPLRFAGGVTPALLTAFSTASSSATLPVTIESTVRDCGISERTSGFVLPLGATINMDGTALYEAVAAVFIANMYGIHLDPGMLVIVFLTSTLAAIGAAGIPEAGLVTMVIVLTAAGLPVEGISMILIIDWALDRCRTTVNVWGDAVGAAVIHHLEGEPSDS